MSIEGVSQSSIIPTLKYEEGCTKKIAYDAIRGYLPSAMEFLTTHKSIISAVIWKKNPELLKEAREVLQDIFDVIMNNTASLSEKDSFKYEVAIGDLLALLPYLGPKTGENISIPLQLEGKWTLVSYKVEAIKLTPKWMGSPLVAYGLTPVDCTMNAPPLLLFKGTTYPTDKGFGLSLITDLNPLASVGALGFSFGSEIIKDWLDKHTINKKAIIFGKSLGGALAWRTAIEYFTKVDKVMAYGAPGLSYMDQKKWKEIVENSSNPPEINMINQKGDDVPYFEGAVEEFNYYDIESEKETTTITAHLHMFSMHDGSLVTKMDESIIVSKWKRLGLTILRFFLSIIVFPLLIVTYALTTSIKKSVKWIV